MVHNGIVHQCSKGFAVSSPVVLQSTTKPSGIHFLILSELFQSQANGVQKRLFEEVQPMHRATEKMYKQLGGSISEKMMYVASVICPRIRN